MLQKCPQILKLPLRPPGELFQCTKFNTGEIIYIVEDLYAFSWIYLFLHFIFLYVF